MTNCQENQKGHCLQIQNALNVLKNMIDLFILVCFQVIITYISHASSISEVLDNSSFSSENVEKSVIF